MARLEHKITDFDLIELNEAFASQSLACLRQLGLADDAEHVNPHGGAIALGHPLGMSGARLALTAVHGLEERGGKALRPCASASAGRIAGARTGLVIPLVLRKRSPSDKRLDPIARNERGRREGMKRCR